MSKIIKSRVETHDNNHCIIIGSEGAIMEMHNKLVHLNKLLPDLIEKLEEDSTVIVKAKH